LEEEEVQNYPTNYQVALDLASASKEERFAMLRQSPEFKKLVPP
jgi:hypothetical protein